MSAWPAGVTGAGVGRWGRRAEDAASGRYGVAAVVWERGREGLIDSANWMFVVL